VANFAAGAVLLALRVKQAGEKNNQFAGIPATAAGTGETVLLANIAGARRCRLWLCWQYTVMAL